MKKTWSKALTLLLCMVLLVSLLAACGEKKKENPPADKNNTTKEEDKGEDKEDKEEDSQKEEQKEEADGLSELTLPLSEEKAEISQLVVGYYPGSYGEVWSDAGFLCHTGYRLLFWHRFLSRRKR